MHQVRSADHDVLLRRVADQKHNCLDFVDRDWHRHSSRLKRHAAVAHKGHHREAVGVGSTLLAAAVGGTQGLAVGIVGRESLRQTESDDRMLLVAAALTDPRRSRMVAGHRRGGSRLGHWEDMATPPGAVERGSLGEDAVVQHNCQGFEEGDRRSNRLTFSLVFLFFICFSIS